MNTSLNSRGGKALEKAVRVTASLGLIFGLMGPMPFSPFGETTRTAAAKDLEWGDVRPPLTDDADSTEADGFRHLPDFGNALHAITVAPNGDIFAAGTGAEVNANGDGDCDDATDSDADTTALDGDCDAAAAVSPVVYKSTDGGMKWRAARVAGAGVGSTIFQIVVSPDYPTDDFVLVVFTDLVTPAGTTNGIAWSTDAGLTFPAANTIDGADFGTEPDIDDVLWLTAALSPDFNYNDGNGELALGGIWVAGAATTGTITTTALKAPLAATTINDIAETTATAADDGTDRTISLAYSYDEEPIALARLFVLTGANTFGQVKGGTWPATVAGAGDEINDDDTTDFGATTGTVGFDDEYSAGGSFFAAAGAGGAVGGVFRYNGSTWAERTLGDAACDTSVESLAISGNGSSTRMVASLSASNLVCRSSNEGSSWSDTNADGGDSFCDECRVVAAGALTRVARNRTTPDTVYYTTSGAIGGVFKSTSSGSSWMDTGLTNQPYVFSSPDEVNATTAFISGAVPAGAASNVGADAFFYTDTYGTGAGWRRSLRTTRTDLNLSLPSGFATHQTSFARFSTATTDQVLRTTDGGQTWDTTGADPFENSTENNETAVASSARSATTYYVGGNKGTVAMTDNGGNTWTLLTKDFGERIDEFDFTSDATTFFVTALDTDTTLKVWMTRDSGATWVQVGDAPWGTGDGTIDTLITGYKPADNSGYLLVRTAAAATTDEVYRIKIGDSTWTDLDIDVEWESSLTTSATGGDGVQLTLWDATAGELFYTINPLTGDPNDFDPDNLADLERDNLLLALPAPPSFGGTSTVGTGSNPNGYTLQVAANGRLMEMTMTTPFRGGITLNQPANNTNVPTNVGDNGTPVVFRWTDVQGADTYDLIVGLDPNLSDGVVMAGITTNLLVVDDATAPAFPLVQGNTYYWAVRVSAAEGAAFEGPWSPIYKFSVASQGAPTQPEPQFPIDNATMPNVGPIQLSWNNPAGTVQFHVQVLPLNNDGPAIDLIIGDPAQVAAASYTILPPVMGQGNYVMLPGATYQWRVRSTTQAGSIGVVDPSWGPWSDLRTFKTPRPTAASITVQPITPSANPRIEWKDSNVNNFYYEVQLSQDRTFNADPATATAAVYWNLVHGGETNPLNSWTLPSGTTLEKGKTYYARVRQRVQATPLGADEPGIGWSVIVSFVAP